MPPYSTNMDGPWAHGTKSQRERHILYHLYMKSKKVKPIKKQCTKG